MTVPETSTERRFIRPCDYYSSATPEPVFPRWGTFGCAAASVLVLLVIFIGGAWLSSGGFTSFIDFAIGMSLTEMRGQYANDLPAARRKALEDEIAALRQNLRDEKLSVASLQPFLEALRRASSDSRITAQEAAVLEGTARKINASAKAK